MKAYKAVRLDRKSHYDAKTVWRVGKTVHIEDADSPEVGPCGRGIHTSPTLLAAVGYQQGPSRYCEVEVIDPIAQDETKTRSRGAKCLRWLTATEQDALSGFRLYEANHPHNPLLTPAKPLPEDQLRALLEAWASVRDRVRDSVRASVRDSVWTSVRASVWASVWTSVRASVGDSVRASVRASVWDSVGDSVWDSVRAYLGGLFPKISTWKGQERLGSDPWRPLLTLWYAGYVPSFDGTTWRLHRGANAKTVLEMG